MSGRIDLHIHTSFSDGLASPGKVLEIVRKKRLTAFAICDHDNVGGYFETRGLMTIDDPELIPGVELSAGKDNDDIHILGYYFDPSSDVLNGALDECRVRRNRRAEMMLMKLKDLGIMISLETVQEIAGKSAIGRPHVADALLKVGAVSSYESAFGKYIGNNCRAYVPKKNIGPAEAIGLIHDAGGLAFLAHPGIGNAVSYLDEFVKMGLDGIEVYHPNHSNYLRLKFGALAESKNILIAGGSDYHGREGRFGMIGSQSVPDELVIAMKEKLNIIHRG